MWRVTDLVVSLCKLLGDKRALLIGYKLTVVPLERYECVVRFLVFVG